MAIYYENQERRFNNIGYVGRETLIATALRAGFVLEAEGFFNRNSKDSTHYAQGVWQLPRPYAVLKRLKTKRPTSPLVKVTA